MRTIVLNTIKLLQLAGQPSKISIWPLSSENSSTQKWSLIPCNLGANLSTLKLATVHQRTKELINTAVMEILASS